MAKQQNKRIRVPYDMQWKELVSDFLPEFIMYFFEPSLFDAIDWEIPPEYLEQEVNDLFAQTGKPKKKIADKLVKLTEKGGRERFVLIHIEFQTASSSTFSERMFSYYMFIRAKYPGCNITVLVIYTGKKVAAPYNYYEEHCYGTRLFFEFNTYIVAAQNEADLLANENPLAMAVLANLYVAQTTNDLRLRLDYKKKMFEIARERNFADSKTVRLFAFIKHLVTLTDEYEVEYENHTFIPKPAPVMTITESDKVYASKFFAAYHGISPEELENKGVEKGAKKGRQEGIIIGVELSIANIIKRHRDYTDEQIADLLGVEPKMVSQVRASLNV